MSNSSPNPSRLALPAFSLWQREVVRFLRQRNRIIGALATPLVFWFLIGSGLGPSFRLPDGPQDVAYIEYFFPGTLVLIMLFTAIFSTISVIEDRREGFLQSVLVAPIAPGAIVLGKLLGGATLAALQALLFLVLAPFIGLKPSFAALLAAVPVFFLVGLALTGLGFLVAWPMESTQGFHAIMNIFLMPLWLLSGALFPAPARDSWVGWVVALNPVSYCVAAVRRVLYLGRADAESFSDPGLGLSLAVCGAFAAGLWVVAQVMVARRRKVTG
jgi:ABC-2 type transport system permease protein